jgi:ABC-2 type transport system permease protein
MKDSKLKAHKITFAIARKEFLHIIHDPRTLAILFLMPIIQLLMFGYAMNLEIQNVNLAVIDFAKSTHSRLLIEEFKGSKFFSGLFLNEKTTEIDRIFKSRQAHAVMIISEDFDKNFKRSTVTPVQFIIDASNANAAALIQNYCTQVLTNFNIKFNKKLPLPFDVRPQILYNPDMKSAYFFVPGLIALLLIMVSALLTSIAITREKEMGTMEQILVSPVNPRQIILGKVLPYIVLAYIIGTVILTIAFFIFNVPFRGNIILLMVLSLVYITVALALGLLISTIARTQQVAMMIALIATLLPTLFLSGFIFPIDSMPKVLQYISYLIPAKYFLFMVRGIILKGSNLYHLLQPTIILILMAFVLLTISIKKFSLKLEK